MRTKKITLYVRLVMVLFVETHYIGYSDFMTLEQYLAVVKEKNSDIVTAVDAIRTQTVKVQEKLLPTSLALFVRGYFDRNASLMPSFNLVWDAQLTQKYSIGIEKQFDIGVKASFSYDVYIQKVLGLPASPGLGGGASSLIYNQYINTMPALEISVNLWSNVGGKKLRRQEHIIEQQSSMEIHQKKQAIKQKLMLAEVAYWNFAVSIELEHLQKEALERAQDLKKSTYQKIKLNLLKSSDGLPVDALVHLKQLEHKKSLNTIDQALHECKLYYGDDINKDLIDVDHLETSMLALEKNWSGLFLADTTDEKLVHHREDIKILKHMYKYKKHYAHLQSENYKPTLDLSLKVSGSGQKNDKVPETVWDGFSNSLAFPRPSQTVQLNFYMPLNFSVRHQLRQAYSADALMAELDYHAKSADSLKNLLRLKDSIYEAYEQFDLLRSLVALQKHKLQEEKKLYLKGRSITSQLLSFEQDYLDSQKNVIHQLGEIAHLLANLKTYGNYYELSRHID